MKNIHNVLCVYSADNFLKYSIFRVSQKYKQVYFYTETQVVSTLLWFCKHILAAFSFSIGTVLTLLLEYEYYEDCMYTITYKSNFKLFVNIRR